MHIGMFRKGRCYQKYAANQCLVLHMVRLKIWERKLATKLECEQRTNKIKGRQTRSKAQDDDGLQFLNALYFASTSHYYTPEIICDCNLPPIYYTLGYN
jgi:hypothetical protein